MKFKMAVVFMMFLILMACKGSEPEPLEISFETNGGNQIEPIIVENDEALILPTPIREGFLFIGWFMDSDFKVVFNKESLPNRSFTLYAKWEEPTSEGLIFTRTDFGTYGVISYEGIGKYVVIPSEHEGIAVTDIYHWAFEYSAIIKVEIPKSIEVIMFNAFAHIPSLREVVFEEGTELRYIGAGAFSHSKQLDQMTIPKSVEVINHYAFSNAEGLKEIHFEEGSKLREIGRFAFSNASSLERIIIPKGVESIGMSAFSETLSLKEIIVEDGNPEYTAIDGVLYDKKEQTLIAYPSAKIDQSFSVPPTVTWIMDRAFMKTQYLEQIEIPSSVVAIGRMSFYEAKSLREVTFESNSELRAIDDLAFYNANSLERMTIPRSVRQIGYGAFEKTSSLRIFEFEEDSQLEIIGAYAFFEAERLEEIHLPKHLEILEIHAFSNTSSLRSVTVDEENLFYASSDGILFDKEMTAIIRYPSAKEGISYQIPNNVLVIAVGAFSRTKYLEQVVIPDCLIHIGVEAFLEAESIKEIDISNNSQLRHIHERAFQGANRLERLFIPSQVASIKPEVFMENTSLKEIIVDDYNEHFSSMDGVLFNKSKTTLLYYPSGKIESSYEIPSGVSTLNDDAFIDSKHLERIILPSSLGRYEINALQGIRNLKEIEVNDSPFFSSMDGVLFSENGYVLKYYPRGRSESTYTIPDEVRTIATKAFMNTELEMIILPDELLIIEDFAFRGGSRLKHIIIPKHVHSIGFMVFEDCELDYIVIESLVRPWIQFGLTEEGNTLIYVNSELVDDYKEAWPWFKDRIFSIDELK